MSIFVHMIGYRDPELLPSIKDCLEKASRPDEINFGICWQHDPEDNDMDQFKGNPKFRIIDVPHHRAGGCCYARSQAQALYGGEDYVLQLDSHHRFEQGWDDTLIEMMRQTGSEKPIITAYAGSYDAEQGKHDCVPWVIRPKPFSRDGSLQFIPVKMPDWENRTTPYKARIASGHFMFTLGKHCLEVPYDPELYFLGEELVMAVRSFTHGYDMFHPHRIVVWHQYHRDGRSKFWGDKPQTHRDLDKVSKERVLKLMGMEHNQHDLGKYGLGSVRTLEEFESYTGIHFKERMQHEDAIAGVEPPTTVDPSKMTKEWSVILHWNKDFVQVPEDCRFIAYIVESESGRVLWRKDVHEDQSFHPGVRADFMSVEAPARLIIWPNLKDLTWSPRKYSLNLQSQTVFAPPT